jgi:hypothetical protein
MDGNGAWVWRGLVRCDGKRGVEFSWHYDADVAVSSSPECCFEGGGIAIQKLYHGADRRIIRLPIDDGESFVRKLGDDVVDRERHLVVDFCGSVCVLYVSVYCCVFCLC